MHNDLNNSLAFNIARVGLLLRRELIQALTEYDITPEQWQVLVILYGSERPLTQSELINHTYQDRHSMSKLLKRLENKEWIIRKKGEVDTRSVLVGITDEGRLMKEKIQQKLSAQVRANSFSNCTSDEKEIVMNVMKKMRCTMGDKL